MAGSQNSRRMDLMLLLMINLASEDLLLMKKRGQLVDWTSLVSDGISFLDDFFTKNQTYLTLPLYITGVSMGGAANICISAKISELDEASHPWKKIFRGSVFISPAIYLVSEPKWATSMALSAANFLGGGSFSVSPAPTRANYSTDEEYKQVMSDPHVYTGAMKLCTAKNLLDLSWHVRTQIPKLRTPFIVLHGDQDAIVFIKGAKELLDNSMTEKEKKKFVVMEGAQHDLVINPQWRPVVAKHVMEWIASLPPPSSPPSQNDKSS